MRLMELYTELDEKQRLDPKCWKGYRKAGTKMKGGVRVNNCVKVEGKMDESLDGVTVEMKNGSRFNIRSISHNPVKQILGYFIKKRDFDILKNISKIDGQDVTNLVDQILRSGSVPNIPSNESIIETERDGDFKDKQVRNMVRAARSAHPDASREEAIALYLDDKERYDFTYLNKEEEDLETRVQRLQRDHEQIQQLQNDSEEIKKDVDELKYILSKLNQPNSP